MPKPHPTDIIPPLLYLQKSCDLAQDLTKFSTIRTKSHAKYFCMVTSLEDIKEMLLDDPELSDYDRFELYYTEHKRVQKEKKKANDMLKKEFKKYKANRKKQIKKK